MTQYHARSTSSMQHQVALSGSHVNCFYNSAVHSQCGFYGALWFLVEPINCCHSGKVSIPLLHSVPSKIYTLFTTACFKKKCDSHPHGLICVCMSVFVCACTGVCGRLATIFIKILWVIKYIIKDEHVRERVTASPGLINA